MQSRGRAQEPSQCLVFEAVPDAATGVHGKPSVRLARSKRLNLALPGRSHRSRPPSRRRRYVTYRDRDRDPNRERAGGEFHAAQCLVRFRIIVYQLTFNEILTTADFIRRSL
ncbi:hypothetical protein EVAR_24486_1 [Eumeta japonica]|uniref:Uncharacterized protein n=1 Tax=Eumeta variegata TaxID=151549 RepID=A0A4C1WWM5_EUMVA|nr:hypothetical protein EVAR_24486_1 [Eumeta japonica]